MHSPVVLWGYRLSVSYAPEGFFKPEIPVVNYKKPRIKNPTPKLKRISRLKGIETNVK